MGFFSDLKEDLSQAVNELMPEEELQEKNQHGLVEDEAITQEAAVGDTQAGVSLDEMLKNIDSIRFPEETGTSAEEPVPESTDEPEAQQEAAAARESMAMQETRVQEMIPEAEAEQEPAMEIPDVQEETVQEEAEEADTMLEEILAAESAPKEDKILESKGADRIMNSFENKTPTDETSVITAGMTITGDISSEGSIDLIGTIVGNIDVLGKLNITGHITGNSKAAEIYAESAKINGEVVSAGAVKIGASSVIIGNITATSAAIAGAVKGDIDVRGPVVLDASAIVMGNIKSKSVQINNGAVIEGMCSQCYADVSPTSFFDEYKPEPKKAKAK